MHGDLAKMKETMKPKIALYPGTFDGLTYGHLDLINRGCKLFDKLIVAVAHNEFKKPWFTVNERIEMLKKVTEDLPNATVTDFKGLTVKFAVKLGAQFIIRGLRAISDFEFELQMALMNRKIDDRVETIFLAPATEFSFLSSHSVKEVIRHNGDVSDFVPPVVEKYFRQRLKLKVVT